MMIYVKVKPNQRFDRIEKSGDDWQIRLKAPATEGKANEHLIDYLSEVLGFAKSKIRLVKGQRSRLKGIEIDSDETVVLEKLVAASKTVQ